EGTITDDDNAPLITINDASATEGNNVQFTVNLSNPSSEDIIVTLGLTDGTATGGTDYTATNVTVTIPAGSTSVIANVPTTDDAIDETDETFTIGIASVDAGTVDADLTDTGAGTINDNDGAPQISINDVSVAEGDVGTVNMVFTVSLSSASASSITVDYATSDNTATLASGDYVQINTTTLTFAPGVTNQTVTVVVNADLVFEGNESLFVDLSNPANATILDNQGEGTITDDDNAPLITINDASATEGNNVQFTVNLSNPSSEDIIVTLGLTDGTATGGTDYTATNVTVTIPAGSTSATATVPTTDDAIDETDETFTIGIASVDAGTVDADLTDTGAGTINDDDNAPLVSLSVSQVTIAENGGTSDLTASLSNISTSNVDVTITYTGTAANGADYTGTTTITIPAGNLSASITLTSVDDAVTEGDETIIADITAVTNAMEDGTQQETVTITDDDDTPDAVDDNESVDENGTLNTDVSTNDTGLGDTPVTFTVTTDVTNGTLTLNTDGTYTYIPDAGFNGTDNFTYTVCDADGECSTATVTITVNPVNNAPIAVNDTTNITGSGDISVLDNDSDPDGDILSITIITDPDNGTAVINNGVITYTSLGDYCGLDSIQYQICDHEPQCATAWVIINVQTADADGDGIPDSEETLTADTDNDGVLDYLDLDSDNDGIPDQIEAHTNGNACEYSEAFDFDEDGTPDHLDLDSDDDGIFDIIEEGGDDDNLDGQVDGLTDNDGDGADDNNTTDGDVDTDGDGHPNYNDLDSDDDGLTDEKEGFENDCDEDGIVDFIDPDECITDIIIPEGFSPNNDGINDSFTIKGIESYPHNKILIVNRWGNKVFEAEPYNNDWDGKNTKGISVGSDDLPEGTYYYILELGNSNKIIKGYIYLNR
ncbi:MAG: Calx-beta domain-containing protein, partial [Bacteroidota bacterium]